MISAGDIEPGLSGAARTVVVPPPSSRLVPLLLSGAALLTIAHFAGLAVAGGHLPEEVNLNSENNLGTWFGSALHLINAGLLAIMAMFARRDRWRWAVLGLLVLGASADETASLHEAVGWGLHRLLDTSGAWTFAWVIPALVVITASALACTTTLLRQPGGRLVLLGGAMFVAGSVGLEMAEAARYAALGGREDTVILALAGLEEMMEMVGAIIVTVGLQRATSALGLTLTGSPDVREP